MEAVEAIDHDDRKSTMPGTTMNPLREPETDDDASDPSSDDAHTVLPVCRVLIVDDDAEDFYTVARLLKRASHATYELTHIDNFEEAVDALRSPRFDVALLDYFIGEFSASDIVGALGDEKRVPFIMLTGKDALGPEREALLSGAFDFLDKNELNPPSLTRSIDFALNRFQIEFRLRQSEERLRIAQEEAEQANRTKSEFLAHMSHELRTPLNAILGYSEILKDDVFVQGMSERYRDYAGAVHKSGHHLLNLINDLLDLSKIEAGSCTLDIRSHALEPLIDEVLTLFVPIAAERSIEIACDVPPVMTRIRADERALKQILVNLVSNAVKFSHEGGTVTIQGRETLAGSTLAVVDSGIGIRPEELEAALKPFEQTSGASHANTNGTGLGLPITKLLVEQHGGTLTLNSVAGEGTRITLQFPKELRDGEVAPPLRLASSKPLIA